MFLGDILTSLILPNGGTSYLLTNAPYLWLEISCSYGKDDVRADESPTAGFEHVDL